MGRPVGNIPWSMISLAKYFSESLGFKDREEGIEMQIIALLAPIHKNSIQLLMWPFEVSSFSFT